MRKRHAALLMLLLLPFAGSCTRAPAVGEPIGEPELAEIAGKLRSFRNEAQSFRAVGQAEMTVSGRTLKMMFAGVYDVPGWLRADLRPELASLSASFTALALLDGDCASLYFPAKLMEVHGCLSEITGRAAWLDPAALLMGLHDPNLLTSLEGATLARDGEVVLVRGTSDGMGVSVKMDGEGLVRSVELSPEGGDGLVLVEYLDYGWKDDAPVPGLVRMTAEEGTAHELYVELRYESLKPGEPIDRADYALDVPAGALRIDWKELNVWR
jgi:hypothetical protein